jgi:hypothetical protein
MNTIIEYLLICAGVIVGAVIVALYLAKEPDK